MIALRKTVAGSVLAAAFMLAVMLPNQSLAIVAGEPCIKDEIGKTQLDTNSQNVIACLVTDDKASQIWKAFSGSSKSYSLTCSDWKESGYKDKDDCIKDGRWHLVYANDTNGNALFGTLNEFRRYTNDGADVKNTDYNGDGMHICQTVGWINNVVMCLDSFRVQGEIWRNDITNNDGTNGLGAGVRRSDGKRISSNIIPKNGGDLDLHVFLTSAGKSFKWYVRF